MNPKAQQFSKKTAIKQEQAQSEVNRQALQSLQQMAYSLFYQVYGMASRVEALEKEANQSRVRTKALTSLLSRSGVTQDEVKETVDSIIVEEFEKNSSDDDKVKSLSVVSNEAAQVGMSAILSIRVFKDGLELVDQQVLRSKVELGKGEIAADVENAVVGMTIGETKRIEMKIEDKTDSAQITLLGLRKPPAATQAEAPVSEASNQNG